jgi:CRISPR-associated protein Cas1
MKDLRLLPKVRDSWSYLYIEHARIEQDNQAVAVCDAAGKVAVPCASLSLLMLGPGTAITQAAVRTLADNGCMIMWVGEQGVRVYGIGMGETRFSRNLLHQAQLWADPQSRIGVVRRLYAMRFPGGLDESLSLRQIRGKEGIRVRTAYARASRATGVPWEGRSYHRDQWRATNPVNRALSTANSCLYGICHAAIVAAGFSPALGFIHTGKMLSFVYDIADLYKAAVSIPVAFEVAADGPEDLESRVRYTLRDAFAHTRVLQRIIPDIEVALGMIPTPAPESDVDAALPGGLWDPEIGEADGGVNWADVEGH